MASRDSANRYKAPRFGEWLRGLRLARKQPLREVAAVAEMDQAHLSKAELGQRMITVAQARRIARHFGIKEQEMLARRITEKFIQDYREDPAAPKAILMLVEANAIFGLARGNGHPSS